MFSVAKRFKTVAQRAEQSLCYFLKGEIINLKGEVINNEQSEQRCRIYNGAQ